MARIEVEILADGIRFIFGDIGDEPLPFYRYDLKVKFENPNRVEIETIPFDKKALKIPDLPLYVNRHYLYTQMYWVSWLEQWIGFNYTCPDPDDPFVAVDVERFHGPFIVPDIGGLNRRELVEARKDGRLIIRTQKLYYRGTHPRKLLEEVLSKKAPRMLSGRNKPRYKLLVDSLCPTCGNKGSVICCHINLGALDYYDNFCHVCLNLDCDYVVHEEYKTTVSQERFGDQLCPFCGRDVYGHFE